MILDIIDSDNGVGWSTMITILVCLINTIKHIIKTPSRPCII